MSSFGAVLSKPWSVAKQLARLRDAGYMELKVPAGAFSCGQCSHRVGPVCGLLQARVSAKYGCCNSFYPGVGEARQEASWAVQAGPSD